MKIMRSSNRLSYFFLYILMIVLLVACRGQAAVPVDPLVMTPEEVVDSFYNWLLEYPGNPRSDGAFRTSPFLSADYIQAIDEAFEKPALGGADPFFCAQDIPEKVFVYPAAIEGDTALVAMETTFANHRLSIELYLMDGEWRIVKVHCGK
jgi:hypothetical protein